MKVLLYYSGISISLIIKRRESTWLVVPSKEPMSDESNAKNDGEEEDDGCEEDVEYGIHPDLVTLPLPNRD
jgi:hypothetical protein